MKEILKRLKSPVVIAAISAEVVTLATLISPSAGETTKTILLSVTAILTAFGVLNNPTDKGNF